MSQRRARLLGELADVIDAGRLLTTVANEPPRLTGEGVVGGVFAVLHARLLEERDEPLTDLLGPLMGLIVLPYLGPKAARRELSRPSRLSRGGSRPDGPARTEERLDGLDMRLTYRTVRVIMAIGAHPGASNREVAEASDIADQGQISKLLNRLAGLNLVENLGDGKERGAANAWRLTARGAQLERATRPRDANVAT